MPSPEGAPLTATPSEPPPAIAPAKRRSRAKAKTQPTPEPSPIPEAVPDAVDAPPAAEVATEPTPAKRRSRAKVKAKAAPEPAVDALTHAAPEAVPEGVAGAPATAAPPEGTEVALGAPPAKRRSRTRAKAAPEPVAEPAAVGPAEPATEGPQPSAAAVAEVASPEAPQRAKRRPRTKAKPPGPSPIESPVDEARPAAAEADLAPLPEPDPEVVSEATAEGAPSGPSGRRRRRRRGGRSGGQASAESVADVLGIFPGFEPAGAPEAEPAPPDADEAPAPEAEEPTDGSTEAPPEGEARPGRRRRRRRRGGRGGVSAVPADDDVAELDRAPTEAREGGPVAPVRGPADSGPAAFEDEARLSPSARRRRRRKNLAAALAAAGAAPAPHIAPPDDRAVAPEAPPAPGEAPARAPVEDEEGRPGEAPSAPPTRRRRRRRGATPADANGAAAAAPAEAAAPGSTQAPPAAPAPDGLAGRRGRRTRRVRIERAPLPPTRPKDMLITVGKNRTQIAVLEEGELVEHYVTSQDDRSIVGNIYLGRVQNVLPGMEAAFINIGEERNAVLYAGEVTFDEDVEGAARRIERVLKSGQPILAQVTKDPIAHKGARLSTEVSLAGRYVVLVPESESLGVSRRLPDDERTRLREISQRLRPAGYGLIVRTAARDAEEEALAEDIARLVETWHTIEAKTKEATPPALIYAEPDLVLRVVRDLLTADVHQVVTDNEAVYKEILDYVNAVTPGLGERMELRQGDVPLFEAWGVYDQLRKGLERRVGLPSGGHLVIDRTEALTVIDVNTGRFVGRSNLEDTVLRTNLEAAVEIAKQLRLRDIGGIIVVDFIDMLLERHREELVREFRAALARDKTRTQVYAVSELGLVQMTRKRISEGLVEAFSIRCDKCDGRGLILLDVED